MSPTEISSLEYLHQTLAPVGTPRILVVEDDPDDLFFHLRVLEKFQCEVITAKSAEEAINLIREDGIDLILLDTNLPKAPPEEVISVASGSIYTVAGDVNFVLQTNEWTTVTYTGAPTMKSKPF